MNLRKSRDRRLLGVVDRGKIKGKLCKFILIKRNEEWNWLVSDEYNILIYITLHGWKSLRPQDSGVLISKGRDFVALWNVMTLWIYYSNLANDVFIHIL